MKSFLRLSMWCVPFAEAPIAMASVVPRENLEKIEEIAEFRPPGRRGFPTVGNIPGWLERGTVDRSGRFRTDTRE
jgi:hypothetical protein